jgi:hypothetical protein
LWNVQDFDVNVSWLGHGSVEVEVFKVDVAKVCTFSQEYTVEEKFEELQGCCVGTHIARVADAVATNGDLCVLGLSFFGWTSQTTMVWHISFLLCNWMPL